MKVHPSRILAVIAAVGALVAAAVIVLPARATPPEKVTTTMMGLGRFANIDAKAKTDINPGIPTQFWRPGSRPREPQISMCCRTRSRRAGTSAGIAIPVPAW